MERARSAGVERILTVGSDYASSKMAVSLAQRYDIIYAAVGIHPHEATRFATEADATGALLEEPKVVAIGEIGLDYQRGAAPRAVQLSVFREQVAWARERNLPISVHNRGADGDVLEVLAEDSPLAILHCFSSEWEVAQTALDGGHYISFAGNLTFPKAAVLREIAGRVPIERLLVETDAPVLAPQPWRGRRNEPAHVVATASALARLRGVEESTIGAATSNNAARIFGWTYT